MMDRADVRWPDSLWAAVTPPGPELPRLVGAAEADVVVIGAGFTGLSSALHLREAGVDVAVVEAAEPGWGASGRNNGQVIPTLSRPDPDDIVARHGAVGERFVALLRDSASTLFDVARVTRFKPSRSRPDGSSPCIRRAASRSPSVGCDNGRSSARRSNCCPANQTRQILGSEAWYGGFWNKSGGHINPLALSRGLVRALLERGGLIFACSPATGFARQNDRWVVKTPQGEISGRALIIATNAYTGAFAKSLAPDIAREVMPVRSWQKATHPLSESARKTIIPGRQAMSDTHGELYFARYDARNRLVTGGAVINPSHAAERLKRRVAERLKRLWPEIGEVKFDYVWNGYVGMTTDFMPRIHRLGPDAYAWTGCNGRAVALSIALGDELSKAVRGIPESELALPFTEPLPIVGHALLRRLAPLMLMLYRRRDAREIA
jgi:glycine/D-amino acid oxidase-like deaminating enzyme